MTVKPILFSAPMVRALLAGTKTQTRRVLSLSGFRGFTEFGQSDTKGYDWHLRDAGMRWHDLRDDEMQERLYYAPGDLLWVRESAHIDGHAVSYKADYPGDAKGLGWRPSIHMPRWASRLTLEVTGVKVERLQDISEEDATAEGVHDTEFYDNAERRVSAGATWPPEILAYADLWTSLHGIGSWEENPWVVAVTFTVHKMNVDDLLRQREAA